MAERIRTIVREEIGGPQGTSMLASIEKANIHGVLARINRRYRPGLPRGTMPSPMFGFTWCLGVRGLQFLSGFVRRHSPS